MNNTPPQYYIFFWRAQIFVLICNCAPSLSSLLVFGHVVGHAHPSIRYFLPSRPYFPDIRCPLRNTSIRLLNFKSPGQFRRNGTLIFCRCAKVNLVSDIANPEMKCDWDCVFLLQWWRVDSACWNIKIVELYLSSVVFRVMFYPHLHGWNLGLPHVIGVSRAVIYMSLVEPTII